MKKKESQLFKSKVYEAFKDAPKRLIETGSGTCLPTGERDYGFIPDPDDGSYYSVTRLRNGKFEVVASLPERECWKCNATGYINKEKKKVIA